MAFKSILPSIFASLNLFKIPIRLKLGRKDYFSSHIGEAISIAIYIYLLYSLVTSDTFQKIHPQVIEKDLENSISDWYHFSETNFLLGAMVTLNGVAQEDPQIFSLKATYFTFNNNNQTQDLFLESYYKADMVLCSETNLKNIYPNLAVQFPTGKCLPKLDFDVGGYFNEQKTSYITVGLELCNNLTSNNTCKSLEEMQLYFADKKLGFLITDTLVNIDDYQEPIIPKISVQYLDIDAKVRKYKRIYLKKVTISSDDGYLVSSDNKIESWKVGTIENDFDFNYQAEIVQIVLYSSNQEKYYKRTYMKVQEALSRLGGIVNVLISVGFILMKLAPYNGLNISLSNHLFSFRNINETKKNNTENIMETINIGNQVKTQLMTTQQGDEACQSKFTLNKPQDIIAISPQKEEKFEEIELIPSPVNKANEIKEESKPKPCLGDEEVKNSGARINSQEEIKENFRKKAFNSSIIMDKSPMGHKSPRKSFRNKFTRAKTQTENHQFAETFKNYSRFKKEKNSLNFTFADVFKVESRKKFPKKWKALKIATKKIQKDLDIMNIMEKFQEIDKLKMILFNKSQLMLFNLISKPEIYVEEEGELAKDAGMLISQNLKGMEERSDDNYLDLVVYYNKIKKNEAHDDMDGRLVKFLDDDMKKYFEI